MPYINSIAPLESTGVSLPNPNETGHDPLQGCLLGENVMSKL